MILVLIAHCTLQLFTRLQYQNGGVSCEVRWCTACETLPFQYCNCVSDCSVQCTIETQKHETTVLAKNTTMHFQLCRVCDNVLWIFHFYKTQMEQLLYKTVPKHTLPLSIQIFEMIEERYVFRQFNEWIRRWSNFNCACSRALQMRASFH